MRIFPLFPFNCLFDSCGFPPLLCIDEFCDFFPHFSRFIGELVFVGQRLFGDNGYRLEIDEKVTFLEHEIVGT